MAQGTQETPLGQMLPLEAHVSHSWLEQKEPFTGEDIYVSNLTHLSCFINNSEDYCF